MVPSKTMYLFSTLILALVSLVGAGLLLIGPTLTPAHAAPPTDVHFVNQANVPIAGTIRVLCYDGPTAGSPIADILITTDAAGYPTTSLPADCEYLAALRQVHAQPSGKPHHGPAYWVYATSWEPGASTPLAANGAIVIYSNRPLVLFNVAVSLAWQPAADSPYLAELQDGLADASRYLYDASNGQMALGPVKLYTGGHNWEGTDLRVQPANDFRPAAYPGGIISSSKRYTSEKTLESTTYVPAAIFLGRYWDGLTASNALTGTWDQRDASRTLIHEWGHYALFLYDEYLNMSGTFSNCTLPQVSLVNDDADASLMYFHYKTSEFWSADIHGLPAPCLDTQQHQFHGWADWETIANWYQLQGIAPPLGFNKPSVTVEGPSAGLVDDLFNRRPGYPIYLPLVTRAGAPAPNRHSEPIVHVYLEDELDERETPTSQVYLLEESAASPSRILYQGQLLRDEPPDPTYLGQITLLGVEPNDRMRVFADHHTDGQKPGQRYVYPRLDQDDLSLEDGLEVKALEDPWQANLDIAYAINDGHVDEMEVILTSLNMALSSDNPPIVQLCATDPEIGCHPDWRQKMTFSTNIPFETWTASFAPLAGSSEFPLDRVIRVQAPDVGEIIRWVNDAGGVGPAGRDAHAPLNDGMLMVSAADPVPAPSACNRVIVMPAANADSVNVPLGQTDKPEPLAGILGTPLDIDILMAGSGTCERPIVGDHNLPTPVTLTFFYDEAQLNRAKISESQLRLIRFIRSPGQDTWSDARAISFDFDLNAISTELVTRDGIYAIGWVP